MENKIPSFAPPSVPIAEHPFPDYTIQQLRYFEAVAECGQIQRASEKLHKAKAAVSKGTKNLREELGVALFEDERSDEDTFVLTSAGKTLLSNAKQVLESLVAMQRAALELKSQENRTLRVGFLTSHLALAIPALEVTMQQFGDWLQVQADDENSARRLAARVQDGTYDVAVTYDTTRPADLNVQPVVSRRLGLVVAKDHELAMRTPEGGSVDLHELRDRNFVLPSSNMRTRKNLDDYFAANNFPPRVTLEANGVATALSMVRRGGLVTILPALGDRQGVAMLRLLPEPPQQLTVVVRHAAKPVSSAAQFFIREVKERGGDWQGE